MVWCIMDIQMTKGGGYMADIPYGYRMKEGKAGGSAGADNAGGYEGRGYSSKGKAKPGSV